MKREFRYTRRIGSHKPGKHDAATGAIYIGIAIVCVLTLFVLLLRE